MTPARKTLLFPTDFASHSQAAFVHATRLASQQDAQILALHVANIPDMRGSSLDGPSYHDELRSQLEDFTCDKVPVEHLLRVADPGPEICRIAKERGCSMIFMGVTCKSGLDQLGLGNVHDFVLHHAPCPVVSYRQQPHNHSCHA